MSSGLNKFFLLFIVAGSCASFTSLAAAQRDSGAQALQVQQAAPANSAVYPLEGIVVNAVTGDPIRNALVRISIHAGSSSLLTGPDGKFHFDNVSQGEHGINIRKPGYFTEQDLNGAVVARVEVGPDLPPVVLKLIPEGVIFGRITDAQGRPAEEVPVKVLYGNIVDGRANWQQQFGTQTNSEGEFRIFELRPFTYYLDAGRFTATFYPGVRDVASATPISVVPGQQIQADFRLQPAVFYQISGTLSGLPPGTSATVEMISPNFGGPHTGFPLHENGSFTQAVSAGRYLLRAKAATSNGELAASVSLDVNSDITGMRLVLSPMAMIPVNFVVEPTRAPRADFSKVELPPVKVGLAATAYPGAERWSEMRPGGPAQALFAIPSVEPGTYRLKIRSSGPWYAAAVRRGSTDLLTQDLVVDGGGAGEPIEITLRDDFASVRGTVTSEGQPGVASVLLMPELAEEQAITIPVDAAGHFQMDSVPPGQYTALLAGLNNGTGVGLVEVYDREAP